MSFLKPLLSPSQNHPIPTATPPHTLFLINPVGLGIHLDLWLLLPYPKLLFQMVV